MRHHTILVLIFFMPVMVGRADDLHPVATVTLHDQSPFDAKVLGLEGGVLHLAKEGQLLKVPLAQLRRLEMRATGGQKGRAKSPRVGLARIELPSIYELAKRLDRIGADWDYVPPDADLDTLRQFDVICFSDGWGQLDGLSELAGM